MIALLHGSAAVHAETKSESLKLSKVHHSIKQIPAYSWTTAGFPYNNDAHVASSFFFFLLLLIRLSSTRTRSTLAPCPPTLSGTWQRRSCWSTRTLWRGNNKARKVCLTVSTRDTQPDLGLRFISLVLFSLFVLLSCTVGASVIGRVTLCCISEEFFLFLEEKKMQQQLTVHYSTTTTWAVHYRLCTAQVHYSLFMVSLAPSCAHRCRRFKPSVFHSKCINMVVGLCPKQLKQGWLSFLSSNIIDFFFFFTGTTSLNLCFCRPINQWEHAGDWQCNANESP